MIFFILVLCGNRLVFITGIPRSGSTLVYNTCRLALQKKGKLKWAGWINDCKFSLSFGKTYLIKIHHYDALIALLPGIYIHSTRNIFEVASSITIKEGLPPIYIIKRILADDRKWKKRCHVLINYIDIEKDEAWQNNIWEILKIDHSLADKINRELQSMNSPDKYQEVDPLTQLHYNHITGGGKNWMHVLKEDYIEKIKALMHD